MGSYYDPLFGQIDLLEKDEIKKGGGNPYHDARGKFTDGGSAGSSGLKGKSTEEAHSTDGVYSKSREAWHQKVANDFIAGKTPSSHPELTIMGGGTAVGKSSLSNKIMSQNPNTVHVDADHFKLSIPEYSGLKGSHPDHAAGLVHEESSYLAKLVTAKSIANNLNVLYDSTSAGTGSNKLLKSMEDYPQYNVHAIFADVPLQVARDRAKARAEDPTNKAGFGRIIHEDLMQTSHAMAAANFMKIKDSPRASSAQLFDTTNKIPVMIYGRSGHSNGVVYDKVKWKAYQEKAATAVGMVRPTGASYSMEQKKVAADLQPGQFVGVDNDIDWKDGEFEKMVAQEQEELAQEKK